MEGLNLAEQIRSNIQKTWPAWKIEYYNRHIAISAHARKLHSNANATREELIRKADALVGKTVYMLSGNGCILRGYIASANLLPLGVYLLVERPGLGDMRVRAEEIDETVFSSYEKVLEMMNTKEYKNGNNNSLQKDSPEYRSWGRRFPPAQEKGLRACRRAVVQPLCKTARQVVLYE